MLSKVRSLFIGAVVIALFAGCEKDERDFGLDIKVTVNNGAVAAQNALVHVYAPVEGTVVDYYLYTNEDGMVSLDFPNKVIVEIAATKSPYKGCTFAELERGLTTVNLDIRLFDDENNGCRENQ
jgi:hypothetical protein